MRVLLRRVLLCSNDSSIGDCGTRFIKSPSSPWLHHSTTSTSGKTIVYVSAPPSFACGTLSPNYKCNGISPSLENSPKAIEVPAWFFFTAILLGHTLHRIRAVRGPRSSYIIFFANQGPTCDLFCELQFSYVSRTEGRLCCFP